MLFDVVLVHRVEVDRELVQYSAHVAVLELPDHTRLAMLLVERFGWDLDHTNTKLHVQIDSTTKATTSGHVGHIVRGQRGNDSTSLFLNLQDVERVAAHKPSFFT